MAITSASVREIVKGLGRLLGLAREFVFPGSGGNTNEAHAVYAHTWHLFV
jgi:hypothetical protein